MTTYVNSLRKLTVSSAVAALLAAGAVQAQTADVGAGVAADAGADVSVSTPGTSVAADVAADVETGVSGTVQTPTAPNVAKAVPAEVDVDVSVGAVAVASDDTVLGTVADAEPQADGSVRYAIDLASDFATGSDRAVVQIEQEVDADGQLKIGMTGEEFAAALTQRLDAGASEQTQTN